MNAVDLLQSQHREIEKLFALIERTNTLGSTRRIIEELADQLAAHLEIEEHQFYPAVEARRTEERVVSSRQEHRAIKRALAEVLETRVGHTALKGKIEALKEQLGHHVSEEESVLFPKVQTLLDSETLKELGSRMKVEHTRLTAGHPWELIISQADRAAPV